MNIEIDKEIYLEKADIQNNNHHRFLTDLYQENSAETSFVWDFRNDIVNKKENATSDVLYNSSYIIQANNNSIGYIDISQIILPGKYVDLVIALLSKYPKKGYAQKTLLRLSYLILMQYKEITSVKGAIDVNNIDSINLARKIGFKTFDTDTQAKRNGIYIFEINKYEISNIYSKK